MWDKLEKIFEELGYPYARQGSYAEGEEIPETVFTFWNYATPEGAFYDNGPNEAVWTWYIYLYTKNPALIYDLMNKFVTICKREGFIPDGRAKDIASDVPDYFGRYLIIRYVENYKE